ncbi:MAG: hypothetical protein ACHP79_01920, partial [Terriglobales bacterium]
GRGNTKNLCDRPKMVNQRLRRKNSLKRYGAGSILGVLRLRDAMLRQRRYAQDDSPGGAS